MKREEIDLSYCSKDFSALSHHFHGQPVAYFDGPGGTQVPQSVIDRMVQYLKTENANAKGSFATTRATDKILQYSRSQMAQFLGAKAEEIAFGANMTTLTFSLAKALGRNLKQRDEIIITQMDHEANRAPWISLKENGVVVKEVRIDPKTCSLDLLDLKAKLNEKTRIVAFTYASNAIGTINDVTKITKMSQDVKAITVVDAVHAAPHLPIDVKEIQCDYLLCSVYKFFGPHLGILYGEREAFERLKTDRVRPQSSEAPYKIESGTLNHEGIAGSAATIDYLAALGEPYKELFPLPQGSKKPANLYSAMQAIYHYEERLFQELLEGITQIKGLKVYGPPKGEPKAPTLAFTIEGFHPQEIASYLGEQGIYVWAGDFYATTLIESLGLDKEGGVVRVGLAPYNNKAHIERLVEALDLLVSKK